MVCKGCQNRREKIKKWVRDITGVTKIFHILDRHQDKWYNELDLKIEAHEKRNFSRGDDVTNYAMETAQKLEVQRGLIKNQKEMIRHRDAVVQELNSEMADLSERVNKLEYPDFKPIEYNIEDLKSG